MRGYGIGDIDRAIKVNRERDGHERADMLAREAVVVLLLARAAIVAKNAVDAVLPEGREVGGDDTITNTQRDTAAMFLAGCARGDAPEPACQEEHDALVAVAAHLRRVRR